MKLKSWLLVFLVLAIIPAGYLATRSRSSEPLPLPNFDLSPEDTSGFQRAEGPIPLNFPADHGAHPDYMTEWWYYTGNLDGPAGEHFGYQLTFFRRALAPPANISSERPSEWATGQAYLAHFALTDVSGQTFTFREKFARGAAGLSGTTAEPYRVWIEDWSVEQEPDGSYRLYAAHDQIILELSLIDSKSPVLHGVDGYSQKGPEPGNASYYISQTSLATSGSVQIGENIFEVSGKSWMDHEYSTVALGPDQVGWDWFSFQLDNQVEIMLFQLRKEDGSIDSYSSGTIIFPDSTTKTLTRDDFEIAVTDSWESPANGAVYPAGWTVSIPSESIQLVIEPYLANQELQTFITYWEGAVRIQGTSGGQQVTGAGYIELTGYAHSMQGEF